MIEKLQKKTNIVSPKKTIERTIYPHSCKKPLNEMNIEEFNDYFKQMKKDLRRIYFLAMKSFIHHKKRFSS